MDFRFRCLALEREDGTVALQGAGRGDIEGWSSQQMVAFLLKIGEYRSMTPMAPAMTRKMSELYGLDDSRNAEIRCAWYLLCIKVRRIPGEAEIAASLPLGSHRVLLALCSLGQAEDASVLPGVVSFLEEQGRMKFIRPLYRAMYRSKCARQMALDTFAKLSGGYHPIASKMLCADLEVGAE